MGMAVTSLVLLLVGGIAVLAVFLVQSNGKADRLQTQINSQATATTGELNSLSLAIQQERTESASDASALQAEFNRKLAEKEETINQQASTVVAVQTQAANLQKEMQTQSANLQKDLDRKSEELEATQDKVKENTSAIGRINDSVFDAKTLYQRARQAVVFITTPSGQGSGFLVGEKKDRVVTAFHVVERMTSWDADIVASNGVKTRARIEQKDKESDLAILELASPLVELEPLKLESGQMPEAGESVAIIGNPQGIAGSIAVGVVSNPAASIYGAVCGSRCPPFLQLDLTVLGGYSGGPVINRKGNVVGVVSQRTGGEIAFTIPAGRVTALMQTPSLPYPTEAQTPVGIDFGDEALPHGAVFQSPRVTTVWMRTFTVSGNQEVRWDNLRLRKLGNFPTNAFRGLAVLLDGEYVFGFRNPDFANDSTRMYYDREGNTNKLSPGTHTLEVKADIEAGEGDFAFSLENLPDVGFSVPDIVTRDGRRLQSPVTITVGGAPFKYLATEFQKVTR